MGSRPPSTLLGYLSIVVVLLVARSAALAGPPRTFRVSVDETIPHSSKRFTQGATFFMGDVWLEGTGLVPGSALFWGSSSDADGAGTTPLPDPHHFGEGIAVLNSTSVYQLTWHDRLVHHYSYNPDVGGDDASSSMTYVRSLGVPGDLAEGWGLTDHWGDLIATDGTARAFRWSVPSRDTAAPTADLSQVDVVTVHDCFNKLGHVTGLNECETVPSTITHPLLPEERRYDAVADTPRSEEGNEDNEDDSDPSSSSSKPRQHPPGELVWSNVYGTQCVVAFDPSSGVVHAWILLEDASTKKRIYYPSRGHQKVANGIAYRRSDDAIFVTGKNWASAFRISLVEDATLTAEELKKRCTTLWRPGKEQRGGAKTEEESCPAR